MFHLYLFLKSKEVTDLDLAISAASICTGLTEHEIDSLPISDLNPLLKAISFIHEELKPQKLCVALTAITFKLWVHYGNILIAYSGIGYKPNTYHRV